MMPVPHAKAKPQEQLSTRAVKISVVISTRNRADNLRDSLTRLANQRTDGDLSFEVLVADNGSTDHTRRVVDELAVHFPVMLRYLYEPRRGKPVAANSAFRQAAGEVLVVTDDDAVAETNWLSLLWRSFQETGAQAIGGRVLPLWVDGRPEWLTDQLMRDLGALGLLDFGIERIVVSQRTDRHYWWVGSNIAVRREVLDRLGGFDERRIRGQDVELFTRYRDAGVKIVYEPSAVVYHKIDAQRLTPEHFRRWYWRTGYYRAHEIAWRPHHLLTLIPLYCYRELWRCTSKWWRTGSSPDTFWVRLGHECRARAWWSILIHRIRLWPRWCLTVLMGRSYMPKANGFRKDAA